MYIYLEEVMSLWIYLNCLLDIETSTNALPIQRVRKFYIPFVLHQIINQHI